MSSSVVASSSASISGPAGHADERSRQPLSPGEHVSPTNGFAKVPSGVSSAGASVKSDTDSEASSSAATSSTSTNSPVSDTADKAEKRPLSDVDDDAQSQNENEKRNQAQKRNLDATPNGDAAADHNTIALNHDNNINHDSSDYNNTDHSDSSVHSDQQEVTLQRRKPGPTPQIQVRPGVTVCQNCLTTTTPLWRRDENGQIMCNACGLFLKLHGRRRPISLKTDVIKSRNRSNRQNRPGASTLPQSKRRQVQTPMVVSPPSEGSKPQPVQPAPPNVQAQPQQISRPPQQQPPQPQQQQQQHLGHPGLPLGALPGIASMGAVSVVYPSSPALSPYIGGAGQGMIINSPALAPIAGPVLPTHHLGQQPLSPQVIAQTNSGPLQVSQRTGPAPMSEQLLPRSPESTDRIPHLAQVPVSQFQKSHNEPHDNKDKMGSLMTRVSELELVNDLLRRRVQDLEASESEARKQVEALKTALSKHEKEQHTKRIKVSELL